MVHRALWYAGGHNSEAVKRRLGCGHNERILAKKSFVQFVVVNFVN